MAKTFRTVGSGSAQTTEPIENNKIPVYDTKTDAESDLANLTVGQIIATKDEGNETSTPVDVVEDGNMHAVTSNAVADSLSYSTDETLTGGKWIDGKPIYRKVVRNTENITGETPTWGGLQSIIADLNIDNCIASLAIISKDSGGGLRYLQFLPSSGFISYYSGVVNGSRVVLEYTKTTD